MNDPITTHIDDYKYRASHAWGGINHEDDSRYYTDGTMLIKRSSFKRPLKRMIDPLKSDFHHYRRVGNKSMDRLWNSDSDRVRADLQPAVTTKGDRRDSIIYLTSQEPGQENTEVILDADKVKFIMTRCSNLTFWITRDKGENNSVLIKSGRQHVAIIMPRRP